MKESLKFKRSTEETRRIFGVSGCYGAAFVSSEGWMCEKILDYYDIGDSQEFYLVVTDEAVPESNELEMRYVFGGSTAYVHHADGSVVPLSDTLDPWFRKQWAKGARYVHIEVE